MTMIVIDFVMTLLKKMFQIKLKKINSPYRFDGLVDLDSQRIKQGFMENLKLSILVMNNLERHFVVQLSKTPNLLKQHNWQLHRTCNADVVGSSPTFSSITLLIQRWHQRWFSCVYNMNGFESYYSDTVAYVWMHTNIERSLVNGSSFYEN